jgi:alpha-methylacyl-CoA racemase
MCGLFEARASGKGQVVDAAAIDALALFTGYVREMRQVGLWPHERGRNAFDSGSHFYNVYETADGKHVAIGALEPAFYATLLTKLGITDETGEQFDAGRWPDLKAQFSRIFRTRTRDQWSLLLEETDTCFAPVLDLDEAPLHPQMQARRTFIGSESGWTAAPAPRFGRTPPAPPGRSAEPGASSIEILREVGVAEDEIEAMLRGGIVHQATA